MRKGFRTQPKKSGHCSLLLLFCYDSYCPFRPCIDNFAEVTTGINLEIA